MPSHRSRKGSQTGRSEGTGAAEGGSQQTDHQQHHHTTVSGSNNDSTQTTHPSQPQSPSGGTTVVGGGTTVAGGVGTSSSSSGAEGGLSNNSPAGGGATGTSLVESPVLVLRCCVPLSTGCSVGEQIDPSKMDDVIKVICNNESCDQSCYMHSVCFEAWEDEVLTFLRSSGRARSWSEKQRRQNLWTKKGYDLAYKACSCRCGKGHLRKDLDWVVVKSGTSDDKKHKRKKQRQPSGGNKTPLTTARNRTLSEHSASGGSPPTMSPCSDWSTAGGGLSSSLLNAAPPRSPTKRHPSSSPSTSVITKFDTHSSDCLSPTGLHRRADFNTFQLSVNRFRLNPYHIRLEEDSHHQDETKLFIFTSLASGKQAYTQCVICRKKLLIYDRLPLLDGLMFLTPVKHRPTDLAVTNSGKSHYLCSVCVNCIEGLVSCIHCSKTWDGILFQLGTMYWFDVFAALPCCQARLSCKTCSNPILDIKQALQNFSDYSHQMRCNHCGEVDHHFVKLVTDIFKIECHSESLSVESSSQQLS